MENAQRRWDAVKAGATSAARAGGGGGWGGVAGRGARREGAGNKALFTWV